MLEEDLGTVEQYVQLLEADVYCGIESAAWRREGTGAVAKEVEQAVKRPDLSSEGAGIAPLEWWRGGRGGADEFSRQCGQSADELRSSKVNGGEKASACS